jgi:predicted nucleic-acid-binding protein
MTSRSTCFVDTNLFVRYLTNDDPRKAEAVEDLLLKAKSGTIRLITSHLVIVELIWVLASYYDQSNDTISDFIRAILNTEGLVIENSGTIEEALSIYEEENIDFVDAYIISYLRSKGVTCLYSYNKKHLSKFKDIKRLEP